MQQWRHRWLLPRPTILVKALAHAWLFLYLRLARALLRRWVKPQRPYQWRTATTTQMGPLPPPLWAQRQIIELEPDPGMVIYAPAIVTIRLHSSGLHMAAANDVNAALNRALGYEDRDSFFTDEELDAIKQSVLDGIYYSLDEARKLLGLNDEDEPPEQLV